MSLTAMDILALMEKAAALGVEVRLSATGGVVLRPLTGEAAAPSGPLSAAERQRLSRARKRENVTPAVTSDGENVTNVTTVTNEKSPPSPSPPPLSPLHPPLPAPTPTPPGAIRVSDPGQLLIPDISRKPIPDTVLTALTALGRKPTTRWSEKELAAWRKLRLTEAQAVQDIQLFARTRAAGWVYHRKDILTLLNNWQAEIERCEDYLRTAPKPNTPPPSKYGEVQHDKWKLTDDDDT